MSALLARKHMRAALFSCALGVLLLARLGGEAQADVFGSTSLLSASQVGQAEQAHDPALSEDGRYVVFDGSVGGVRGVWRRATAAGAPLEQVAGGDAQLPSVSADGRYVSFTTNEGESLPAITDGLIQGAARTEPPGVYVRDMTKASGQEGAFTLASAKNNSSASLVYQYREQTEGNEEERREAREREESRFGSTAAGRSAISADGRHVVFVTTAPSDLAGRGTPPLEVAVRNLDTLATVLVSVRYDPATGRPAIDPETGRTEPVPEAAEGSLLYGAVYSTGSPPQFFQRAPRAIPELAGASISADGSTVAWLGQQIGAQARTLSGETPEPHYVEPLWRRIAAGPEAPTRRVTGGADPENPACIVHPEASLPPTPLAADPCQGPFATQATGGLGTWNNRQAADTVPRLSANGDQVAFIASAPLLGEVGGFGGGAGEENDDAYVVDMSAPSKSAGLRQLTRFASGEASRVATNAQIEDIGISPDGTQIAFTTSRIVFPLGTPAYVSVPAAAPGLLEVYDADLTNQTLTRVTQGFEGGLSAHPHEESSDEDPYAGLNDGALSPSFSADGLKLSFASTASNLVYGDGNTPAASGFDTAATDGSDAFLINRIVFNPEPTPQSISTPPANPVARVPWKLGVEAVSLANGSMELSIEVPGGGRLVASASTALEVRAGRHQRLVRRTVASLARTIDPTSANPARFKLVLRPAYRRLATRRGGLAGKLAVTFSAPGHPTLRGTVSVRFLKRGRGAG